MMVITSRATRTNNIEYTLLYPSFVQRIAGEIKSFSSDGWVALKLLDKFMLYMLTAGKKALEYGQNKMWNSYWLYNGRNEDSIF